MKKLFALVAVLAMVASASANVLWTENFVKDGESTYVDKKLFEDKWPYANQWFEKGFFQNEYSDVKSYSCSIRNKKVLSTDEKNSIGLYFGANKTADQCYVTFSGSIFTAAEGNYLVFTMSSPEQGSAAEDVTPIIEINEKAVNVAGVNVPENGACTVFGVALPAGDIKSLKISYNSLKSQKFITSLQITDEMPQAIENVFAGKKVTKTIENGQMVMIIDGVRYNAMGAKL